MRHFCANLRHVRGWAELLHYWFQGGLSPFRRWDRSPFWTRYGFLRGLCCAWEHTLRDYCWWERQLPRP